MINPPKISIVTPSYNQGQYIEQTILSIINQGYPNLEYIIIDGGSSDDTVEIIKKYSDKITYWISEKDRGQSDAINKGLERCTGVLFNWLNSDDFLAEGALQKIAEYYLKYPTKHLICGWCDFIYTNKPKQEFRHRSEIFNTLEETIIQQRINQPASFYMLDIVKSLGGINGDLNYAMDLDLWFRYLVKHGQENILLIDDLLANFRIHDNSKTVQSQTKFREEEKLLWFHMLGLLKANNSLLDFFSVNKYYSNKISWQSVAINKYKLLKLVCEKYFFEFYRIKNYSAARFAFWNQLSAGKLSFKKIYFAMFYHLFFKR